MKWYKWILGIMLVVILLSVGPVMARNPQNLIIRRTLVVITTDHGFVEGGRGHGLCVPATKRLWLVVNQRPRILDCVTTQTDIAGCLKTRL